MKLRELKCPNCLAPLTLAADSDVVVCEYCGTSLTVERPPTEAPAAPVINTTSESPQRRRRATAGAAPAASTIAAASARAVVEAHAVPQKSRPLTAVLAFVLGLFGVHHFYLGNKKLGLAYLAFFWTYFPAIIGWLEGLSCLFMSDDAWSRRRSAFIVNKKGTIAFVIMMIVLYLIGTYA